MSVFERAATLLGEQALSEICAQADAAPPLTEAQLTILTDLLLRPVPPPRTAEHDAA